MRRRKTIVIGTFDYQVFANLNSKLSGANYDIRFVQRGVKILLEILDNDIDLLILDLDLAGVLGIEILPVIRRLRPRLPVILITEDVNTRIRKMAAELGVTYQAYKPMTNAETEAIVSATERLMERQPVIEYDYVAA
ncbi:MAG: response regulator [Calditrichaeota bacterium]|nr:MAG: response regulator [Calditrichota bacterium]